MAGAITAQAWPPPQSLEVQPLGPLRPIHITITITTTATTASRTLAAITAATTTNRTLAAITAAMLTGVTSPDGRRCFPATTKVVSPFSSQDEEYHHASEEASFD